MTQFFETKIFILVFISIGLTKTFAQTTTTEITDKFFSLYSKDPIKAVDYAFSTNKWFDRQQDGVANLKNKLKNTIDLCGDYYGHELLSEKTAGPSIKMITYIVKYDREPIRFTFFMYKAKDAWRVNNFSYDENIDSDLEEATKAYRLKENISW
jgi:hypothetical protein